MKRATVKKCDLTEALLLLRGKDTFPLHIWSVLLQGAGVVLAQLTLTLSQDVTHLLLFSYHNPKKTSLKARSLIYPLDTVPPPVLSLLPPLPPASGVLPTLQALTLHTTQFPLPSGPEDIFGPQEDFEHHLPTYITSNSLTQNYDVDTVPATPAFHSFRIAGNETTVPKRKNVKIDRICCISKSYLMAWALQTEGITKWDMQPPPLRTSFALPVQLHALSVYQKNTNLKQIHVENEVKIRDDDENMDRFDIKCTPKTEFSQESDYKNSSKVEISPDIAFPAISECSFYEIQRENPHIHPSSLFYHLLCKVKSEEIELAQNCEFSELRVCKLARTK